MRASFISKFFVYTWEICVLSSEGHWITKYIGAQGVTPLSVFSQVQSMPAAKLCSDKILQFLTGSARV